ncbi:MAG: class I SAM-dependent methyltransferase [Syntrophobacterales bacterium]|nr:MAG: class I SAM-dependent methyltransferase [Syntrophobacterales bacterium]
MIEALICRGLNAVAVDQSGEMLSEMQSKFAVSNVIEYRVGEGENLPIPDDSIRT